VAGWRLEAHRLDRPDIVQEVGENAVAARVAEVAQFAVQTAPGRLRAPQAARTDSARTRELARPRRTRAVQRRLQATLDVFLHRLAVEPHLAAIADTSHPPPCRCNSRIITIPPSPTNDPPPAWKGTIIGPLPPVAPPVSEKLSPEICNDMSIVVAAEPSLWVSGGAHRRRVVSVPRGEGAVLAILAMLAQ
jgi:hypothetical protein